MSTVRQPVNSARGKSPPPAKKRRKTLRVKSIPDRDATGTIHDNESLTLEAFCRRLKITAAEVVRYRRAGLRAVRVGRQIQIRGRDWNQFLDSQPTAPVPGGTDKGTMPNVDQNDQAGRHDHDRGIGHDSVDRVGRSAGEAGHRSPGRDPDPARHSGAPAGGDPESSDD